MKKHKENAHDFQINGILYIFLCRESSSDYKKMTILLSSYVRIRVCVCVCTNFRNIFTISIDVGHGPISLNDKHILYRIENHSGRPHHRFGIHKMVSFLSEACNSLTQKFYSIKSAHAYHDAEKCTHTRTQCIRTQYFIKSLFMRTINAIFIRSSCWTHTHNHKLKLPTNEWIEND